MKDDLNERILVILRTNARASWAEIGSEVHLTGQAVAQRVKAMENTGQISGYTLREDQVSRYFVTMLMSSSDFVGFESTLQDRSWVEAAYKTAGDACYELVVRCEASELDQHLEELLLFGRYKVSNVLRRVK
jgi:Lrp/AsnC family leucine-responsive transcriptional regulator